MDARLLIEKRDAKAKPHLGQYAPVWLIDESVKPSEDTVLFDVLFQHHQYGWIIRRYRYDGFNNVLYYSGEMAIPEEESFKFQDKEPFLSALAANIPNSYGG